MQAASDEHIEGPAKQLASLGEAGWQALVHGLQHEREIVRQASERALSELVSQWRTLPPAQSAARVPVLARMLAQHIPEDPVARRSAAHLAEQLLTWPVHGPPGVQVVYDCEQVLRAARHSGWPRSTELEVPPAPPRLAAPDPVDFPEPQLISREDPESAGGAVSQPPLAGTPEILPVDRLSQPAEAAAPLGLQPIFSPVPEPRGAQPESERVPPEESALAESSSASPPDWSKLEIHELLHAWRQTQRATEAENELRRREFDEINLRVARTAATANPEARIQLIQLLPQLSGISATNWLLVLARDESPRVRAAAVQMLATTSNPRIHRQLEKLEEVEPDAGLRSAMQKSRSSLR